VSASRLAGEWPVPVLGGQCVVHRGGEGVAGTRPSIDDRIPATGLRGEAVDEFASLLGGVGTFVRQVDAVALDVVAADGIAGPGVFTGAGVGQETVCSKEAKGGKESTGNRRGKGSGLRPGVGGIGRSGGKGGWQGT
jgi:hypothetical protein